MPRMIRSCSARALSVIDRESGGEENYAEIGVRFLSLVKASEILKEKR